MLQDWSRVVLALLALCTLPSVRCNPDNQELRVVNVSHNVGNSSDPSAAVDSRGTIHLVWTDDTPGREHGNPDDEEVLYSCKTKTGVWSEPTNVSRNGNAARFPAIAVGPDDKLHVVWQGWIPGVHWRIFYSEKITGADWTAPETLAAVTDCITPEIAADDAGNAHVAWEYGGFHPGINYATRTSVGSWSAQETVHAPDQTTFPYDVSLAVDGQRNVYLAWSQDSALTSMNVFYAMKPANGSWTHPENISRTDSAWSTVWVGADRLGTAQFVWPDRIHPLNSPNILHRSRLSDGTWTPIDTPCTLVKTMLDRTATLDEEGNLIIPGGDSDWGLLYVEKQQGSKFSEPIRVGRATNALEARAMVCDQDGYVTLFWTRGDTTGTDNEDIFSVGFQTR